MGDMTVEELKDKKLWFLWSAKPAKNGKVTRDGYECKALLQGKSGMPVAVSQKMDKDFPIWKVQYGFSCLVFPTYEDAMDFCRGRFTRIDGKAV